MVEEQLEHAVNLIKAGNIDQGRKVLVKLLKENQKLERAWAWLYVCVTTDEQRIYCLKKFLELNPNNEKVKSALEKLMNHPVAQNELAAQKIAVNQRRNPKSSPERPERVSESKPGNATSLDKSRVFELDINNVVFDKPIENTIKKSDYASSDFSEIESGMHAVMLGARLMIGGISITPNDCPKCFEVGRPLHRSQCHLCEFFAASDCPILEDPHILHEVGVLFSQYKHYWQEKREHRTAEIDAIYGELKDHGRPLHYEILAQIIRNRYPRLKFTSSRIVKIMGRHPEKFEWIDKGVYRAK